MLTASLWLLAGLVVLIFGAELIVSGGTKLATRLGISPIVIGLTIVAVGTSTPELAVGIDAALQGNGDLAIGNIAGTNVVNILFILGLSAFLKPVSLRTETFWLDLPMIVIASIALLFMAGDGLLSRSEGIVLVAASLFYTGMIVYSARRESRAQKASFATALPELDPAPVASGSLGANLGVVVIGIVIVIFGADWLVKGAVDLARLWHVSDEFIGLTIVAIGTSAPELVTTVVSTIRNKREIAIGNLLGSSVYNILVILGITCIVPSSGIPVAPALINVDIPIMVGVSLVCVPVFLSGRTLSRLEGGLFVVAYMLYLAYLVSART